MNSKAIYFFYIAISFAIALSSCAPKPFAATNKIYKKKASGIADLITRLPSDSIKADSAKYPRHWAGTVNFGIRKPNFVILHHTAQNSCNETVSTFTKEHTQVSAHYVICKDGMVFHMLNDYLRAWHAGASKWGSVTDINSASIGIELDNNGSEPFSAAQLNTLLGLLADLKKAHNIPAANFIGHGDIAPTRKTDPNVHFPWKQLAENGYGHWYSDTANTVVPAGFDPVTALRIIGYDVSKLPETIEAFRRHFIQTESKGALSEQEKKVLYVLMQKYY